MNTEPQTESKSESELTDNSNTTDNNSWGDESPENSNSKALDPDLEKEIAGFDSEQEELLEQEYMLVQDSEEAEEKPFSQRGVIRLLFGLGATGLVVIVGILFWNLFVIRRSENSVAEQQSEPQQETPFETNETGQLKARMAFEDQQRTVRDAEVPPTSDAPSTPEPAETQPKKELPSAPAKPVSRPASGASTSTTSRRSSPSQHRVSLARPSPPPPRPESRQGNPAPTRTTPTSYNPSPPTIRMFNPSPPSSSSEPSEEIDPFERWNQLASIGQQIYTGDATEIGEEYGRGNLAPTATPLSVPENPQSPAQPSGSGASARSIPTVVIGRGEPLGIPPTGASRLSSPYSSPGERGIIEGRRVSTVAAEGDDAQLTAIGSASDEGYRTVALGTTARGQVVIPMFWDEGTSSPLEPYYALELKEPLLTHDGEVALPAGTLLIAEVVSVGEGNRLVNSEVVAMIYRDSTGQMVQQHLEPGTFSIQGNNAPLIANGYFDPGPGLARQDLLVSLFSSLGAVGSVVNQPDVISTASSGANGSSGTSTTTTVTSGGDSNLLAAAVQGFFQPLAEGLQERAETQTQDVLARANIAVLPQGTEVTVAVRSFLYVAHSN